MLDYAAKIQQGLSYADFLSTYGTDEHRSKWAAVHQRIALNSAQRELLAGFTREMKVLCLTGAWCGDCVNQCPIFDHFAQASPKIQMLYFDRDAHPDLGSALSVCGGARVPVVLFLSEDNQQVGFYGDRTLSKYRVMASTLGGAACSTGIAEPQDLERAVVQDWLNEFERIQLILRTSARLRKKHGD